MVNPKADLRGYLMAMIMSGQMAPSTVHPKADPRGYLMAETKGGLPTERMAQTMGCPTAATMAMGKGCPMVARMTAGQLAFEMVTVMARPRRYLMLAMMMAGEMAS
jgi:hypothetical protein